MAETTKGITVPVKARLDGVTAVATTPAPADIIETGFEYLRYAASVTEQHGLQVRELNEHAHRQYPFRTSGARQVSELTSLLDELTRRPLTAGASTLWGDYNSGRITAIYNDDTDELPGWRDDLLHMQLVADPDWAAWAQISGKWFSQEDFGDVVEELLHTVIDPDQADLLEIINSIRATRSAEFESRIDRSTSSQHLTFSEEVRASAGGKSTGTLEVPKTVTLRLRPWEGHVETYDIEAWFRLNVNGGHLALMIKLKPTQQILRQAWADLVTKIVAHTGIPVLAYRGTR